MKKGEHGLKTTEQFHNETVEQLLRLSSPKALKQSLTTVMENALSSETLAEFPEQIPEHYYSFKVLHNFLVKLVFFHETNLKAEDLML